VSHPTSAEARALCSGLTLLRPDRLHSLMNLYSPDLLAELPEPRQDGPVAALCRDDSDTDAPAAAALIEEWVERYKPPLNIQRHLVAQTRTTSGRPSANSIADRLGEAVNRLRADQVRTERPLRVVDGAS
jgi:hypothetical protein